jgi:hypothetical protein
VVITCHERGASPALAELDRVTKKSADECSILLRDELERLSKRYSKSLQTGGSGNALIDMYKKAKFATERETINALRKKLCRDTQSIVVLVGLAAQ